MENVHSIFLNVQKVYSKNLRLSIESLIENGSLKNIGLPRSYNYLLTDGTELSNLLDNYRNSYINEPEIRNEDFEKFKNLLFYVGKGANNRKFSHFTAKKMSRKLKEINKIWAKGHGITVLQLFSETNDYVALSREYSIIKALKKTVSPKLTNSINSVAYGDMKEKWTSKEIINFGNMLIYNAFTMAIKDQHSIIYRKDIKM